MGDGPTRHRIEATCAQAMGSGSTQGIALAMQNYVATYTTFGWGQSPSSGWPLLDDGYGDCAHQAETMKLAVEMLGAGPAYVQKVRASTDGGAGHCLNLQDRYVWWPLTGRWERHYLIMFGGGGWQSYEGCCSHGTGYYSVTPAISTSDDYTMLLALINQQQWQQWWVYTANAHPLGQPERLA